MENYARRAGGIYYRAPAVHILRKLILDAAKDKKNSSSVKCIIYLNRYRYTDAFAYSNSGVPSALISLPLKYMHTTVETCHKEMILKV
jgi:putative aminopeptidase FrvX